MPVYDTQSGLDRKLPDEPDEVRPVPPRKLPDADILYIEDVAAYYGIRPHAMRKRIRLGQDCPAWHKKGKRWVVRKRTFLHWLDEQEGLAA